MCKQVCQTFVFPQRGSGKSMEPARNGALTEIATIKKQSHEYLCQESRVEPCDPMPKICKRSVKNTWPQWLLRDTVMWYWSVGNLLGQLRSRQTAIVNMYQVTKVFLNLSFTVHFNCMEISRFTPVLYITIVRAIFICSFSIWEFLSLP